MSGYSQVSLNELNLANGAYQVGFRHDLATGSSRTYHRIYDWSNKTVHRPIPISIWYPCRDALNKDRSQRISDYMDILKEEEEWEFPSAEQQLNWFYYPNTPPNQAHLQEKINGFSGSQENFPEISWHYLCAKLSSRFYREFCLM